MRHVNIRLFRLWPDPTNDYGILFKEIVVSVPEEAAQGIVWRYYNAGPYAAVHEDTLKKYPRV